MSDSKNDVAWNSLFEKHRILDSIEKDGSFLISATQINTVREARLMTKFDYRSQLPEIFEKNDLAILPISRGDYLISDFSTFHNFDNSDIDISRVDFPSYIESIDYNNITSESMALNCAYISGMIEDFTEDEDLKPTVNGRMSSLGFEFDIDSKNKPFHVSVKNSQIEIDGGYEGFNSLNLIEAKNSISKDFLIRQIYYPYRLWSNKIQKKVRNIFLTYTNGVFHFREYVFQEPNHYNSLILVKQKKYIINEGIINNELIFKTLQDVVIVQEPKVPFPQADSFERLINLCELLHEKDELNQENITENYDFDKRQTNYYTSAGIYLDLIAKKKIDKKIVYYLTEKGKQLFKLSIFDRQIKFIKLILSHKVFNKTLELYFKKGSPPTIFEIVQIMKNSNLYNVDSDSTYTRRASTVSHWINWIMELVDE